MAGTGSSAASSGSQIRAASWQPSRSGMRTFSISRTARGKLVTCRSALPPGWPPALTAAEPRSGAGGRESSRYSPAVLAGRGRARHGPGVDDGRGTRLMTLVPPPALASFPRPVREIENLWIPLPDGTRLAARAWLPEDAERDPAPAILEYLPYRKRD